MSNHLDTLIRRINESKHVADHSACSIDYNRTHDTYRAEIVISMDTTEGVAAVTFTSISDASTPAVTALADTISSYLDFLNYASKPVKETQP